MVEGQLSAYSPYIRPQDVEAMIAGRIAAWRTGEGMKVKAGDEILQLEDIHPDFLAPHLLTLLTDRQTALTHARHALAQRVEQLHRRIGELRNVANAAVPSAEATIREYDQRVHAARAKVEARRIGADTAELNLHRHKILAAQGLESQRRLEQTINEAIGTKSELQAAYAALQAAKQVVLATRFGRDQISAEVQQRVLDAEAGRDEVRAEAAKAVSELADIKLLLANATQRRIATRILAPIDGTLVRMVDVGVGQTVLPGDKLARISPDSADPAIEMVAEGADAPLLNVGRRVRIMFYGIPALPLSAWPELMAGTYGGIIRVIDQVDDGRGNFRFWVIPDPEERPWPLQENTRQGIRAMGWVVLNRVPAWYELWRRFNRFPPDYQEGQPGLIDTLLPRGGRERK